jgi:hypothetical protein
MGLSEYGDWVNAAVNGHLCPKELERIRSREWEHNKAWVGWQNN